MLDYVENSARTYVLWKLKVHQILTAHLHKLPSSLGDFLFSSINLHVKIIFVRMSCELNWSESTKIASNFLSMFAL